MPNALPNLQPASRKQKRANEYGIELPERDEGTFMVAEVDALISAQIDDLISLQGA